MSESDESRVPEEKPVYASPQKRVWAWVGVVYMVILTLLITYYLAHAAFLNSIGPLMLLPALGGLGASSIVNYRTGRGKGGLGACIAITALSVVLIVVNLYLGLPSLLAQLGG